MDNNKIDVITMTGAFTAQDVLNALKSLKEELGGEEELRLWQEERTTDLICWWDERVEARKSLDHLEGYIPPKQMVIHHTPMLPISLTPQRLTSAAQWIVDKYRECMEHGMVFHATPPSGIVSIEQWLMFEDYLTASLGDKYDVLNRLQLESLPLYLGMVLVREADIYLLNQLG